MERALTSFVRALRAAGARVSTAEAIDAARTVALVGYGDRNVLKNALGITLAKTEGEKGIHDALFELYFYRQSETEPQDKQGRSTEESSGENDATGGEDEDGLDYDVDKLMALAQAGGGAAAAAMERAAAAAQVENIRFATQASYYARRMLKALGIERMEQQIVQLLEAHSAEGEAQARRMIEAQSRLQKMARQLVDQHFEVYGRRATETFQNEVIAGRSIDDLDMYDMERVKAVVARLAKRLADRHARRRRLKDRGKLDVRKTIRASAGYDGVPFDVFWKVKKRDRPKIVAVCDVSGSVARYVRFLLMLLYALNERVADLRSFAFSSHLADVGDMLEQQDLEPAMNSILRTVGGGSTDYGQALLDLSENFTDAVDRRTTVLILGDGRSNHSNPRLDLFRDMADQAKRVIWLCPEPPGLWGSGDSILPQYRPFCASVTHCATISDIEKAIDDILLAYD
jgi:uncharacterized protein